MLALGIALSVLGNNGFSANWYVRPSSAGGNSGADWNNAWSSASIKWSSVAPGDTIWLAGGAYGAGISIGKSGTVGNPIYIKRVTSADSTPVAAAGWSSSFDSQVVISQGAGTATFGWPGGSSIGSYVTIDGRTTAGILGKQSSPSTSSGGTFINIYGGTGRQSITVTNANFQGPGIIAYTADTYACFVNDYPNWITNFTLANSEISGVLGVFYSIKVNGITADHITVHDISNNYGAGGTAHGQIWYAGDTINIVCRYSTFYNWDLFWISLFGAPGPITIYGCKFGPTLNGYQDPIFWPCYPVGGNSSTPMGPLYFYNNTVVKTMIQTATGRSVLWAPGSQARNNIYWASPWQCGAGSTSEGPNNYCYPADSDYNFSDTSTVGAHSINSGSNPFADMTARDYHIVGTVGASYPKDKGVAIPDANGKIYNLDMDGNTRGADGLWDIGAYEYGSIGTNPVILVSPGILSFGPVLTNTTSDLPFIVQNIGGGTLAGTVSAQTPFSVVSGGSYSLSAGQSQTVTVRFAPGALGSAVGTVTCTGGGGTTVSVSGTGVGKPPIVSAITQSPSDADPVTGGLQIYSGSVAQYSGSASDPNGLPLTWQWIYTVDGGPEVLVQSGTGTVSTTSYTYATSDAGSSYVWKLRVSNGLATAESDLTVGVKTPPPPAGSLTFQASAGAITAPFTISGGYLSQTIDVSNLGQAGVTNGGLAVYTFNISTAGTYTVSASVNAPNSDSKSFWVNIDALPDDPTMIWDNYPYTAGFETRTVSWRGSGGPTNDQFNPKTFNLAAGTHELIIVGREANVQLGQITISPYGVVSPPPPPQNLHIVAGP